MLIGREKKYYNNNKYLLILPSKYILIYTRKLNLKRLNNETFFYLCSIYFKNKHFLFNVIYYFKNVLSLIVLLNGIFITLNKTLFNVKKKLF